MAKGVMNRIGFVYCIEIDNKYKCYFQFIARDSTQLGGEVIRVFKHHYELEENPTMDEIVSDEVDFYTHTVLKVGNWFDAWCVVGKHNDLGDVDKIVFRDVKEIQLKGLVKSYNWYVWNIGKPRQFIGELTKEYAGSDWGIIFPYFAVIERIKTGKHILNEPE